MQRGQRIRAVGTANGGGGALVCLFSACSNANTFFQSRTRSIANWTWKRIGWLGPQPAIVVKGGDALRRGHVVRPPGSRDGDLILPVNEQVLTVHADGEQHRLAASQNVPLAQVVHRHSWEDG